MTTTSTPLALTHISEGKYTNTIYSYIKDQKFAEVIKILTNELQSFPDSRAALSLLAYCNFQVQDFAKATNYYEQLVRLHPEVENYKLFYAQSLYKAGQYAAAQNACFSVEDPAFSHKVLKLQAAIKFETGDVQGCRLLVNQADGSDPDTLVNQACLLYKEGKHKDAMVKYAESMKLSGNTPELSYYLALCHYMLKQYVPALKYIGDIIERGIREHPELNVGMATEGLEVRSVGNSQALHESFLVEAFNLKASIEYQLRNFEAAQEALTDMPPRFDSELDSVTLHNHALMGMDKDASGGFEKLGFLLNQGVCPPETFTNFMLLYLKYEYFDLAADMLAENAHLAATQIPSGVLEYIEAVLLRQSSKDESYKRLDDSGNKHVEGLRKLSRAVQEARSEHDEDKARSALHIYKEAVDAYIPVLMAAAKIHWDTESYATVEKIFRKSVEFCNDHETWRLNVAHVLFMQEKFKEAISFYEPIVREHTDSLLDVTAIVLANICVSYIMTSQNEDAEELMRKIEKEEEKVGNGDSTKRTYHLCIVNLVIGTLYCSKGNYEFGISRVMKSLEPFSKKLGTDTWYYTKRCFTSLFEMMAKHMVVLNDSVYADTLVFFDQCEFHGRAIPAIVDPMGQEGLGTTRNTVAYEARLLKSLFIRLYE